MGTLSFLLCHCFWTWQLAFAIFHFKGNVFGGKG
uniref:Uncharacterized protein n=1 Tax=Anguilla anguilla TaxID=7936 RepID=A0A0E9WAI9_ANGAN